jgi:hypothetical protein
MKRRRLGLLWVGALGCCALMAAPVADAAGRGRGGGGGGRGGSGQVGARRGGGGGQGGQRRQGSGARGAGRGTRGGGGGAGRSAGRGGGSQNQNQYQHRERNQGEGQGQANRHQWQYNSAEERQYRGTVAEEPDQGRGRGGDTSILVRGEDGSTRRVQLGPPWYVDGLDVRPQPGDAVEIMGAAGQGEGAAITARQMNWNGNTYRFRDREGTPLWAGAAREGWGHYAGAWNGGDIAEVAGEIEGIEGLSPGGADMGRGVVLRLRTRQREMTQERDRDRDGSGDGEPGRLRQRDEERLRVHLGPYWYVEKNMPGLQAGQQVTIRGGRATGDGEDALLATEMTRNQERLRLRTREGRPEWAGGWQNWDGWGPGSEYTGKYDPARIRTVEGTVESVEEMTPMPGMGRGLALNVRTREGTRERAHVGPMWFAEQSDIVLAPGEPISLTGSGVEMNGRQILMVRDLEQANRRVRVREHNGTPVWSGIVPAEETSEDQTD